MTYGIITRISRNYETRDLSPPELRSSGVDGDINYKVSQPRCLHLITMSVASVDRGGDLGGLCLETPPHEAHRHKCMCQLAENASRTKRLIRRLLYPQLDWIACEFVRNVIVGQRERRWMDGAIPKWIRVKRRVFAIQLSCDYDGAVITAGRITCGIRHDSRTGAGVGLRAKCFPMMGIKCI